MSSLADSSALQAHVISTSNDSRSSLFNTPATVQAISSDSTEPPFRPRQIASLHAAAERATQTRSLSLDARVFRLGGEDNASAASSPPGASAAAASTTTTSATLLAAAVAVISGAASPSAVRTVRVAEVAAEAAAGAFKAVSTTAATRCSRSSYVCPYCSASFLYFASVFPSLSASSSASVTAPPSSPPPSQPSPVLAFVSCQARSFGAP
jgi:hypothetical protein